MESGIILIKFWLEVSNEEQERRFEAGIEDPCANGSSAQLTCRRVNVGTSTPGRAT
jgi:hypothetical protein